MKRIEISRSAHDPWFRPLESLKSASQGLDDMRTEDADPFVRYRINFKDNLHLTEVIYQKNDIVSPHAHSEDEIVYVLDGELKFGRNILCADDAILIKANTLYSFSAGKDGARILIFRRIADQGMISKVQYSKVKG